MKLYKEHQGSLFDKYKYLGPEATLSDLKAALAEHGMVAVPVEPTEDMYHALINGWASQAGNNMYQNYEDMIQAAQEK